MSNRRRTRFTEKSQREQSEELTGEEFRKQRSWHCGTIHHRITEAPKGFGLVTLLLSRLRVHGLRVHFTAFHGLRPSTQGPPESGNKLQMTFRNSSRFPEGHFSGHDRLPASLRGTSTKNRDHNEPRAPQDIQGTLRKSRSQAPRPPRANGPRPRTTSQRSPTGQKDRQNECWDAQRAIGDQGALNSVPNVQTGQNRLSRRRVVRTLVHTTHGDIRLIRILVVQAF
ncbi:hypothetical protein CRG98_003618 [Punica granatum]|uniref:Uncharacterized protein n=1 Tax=Punica granatum TaxID=22663 RepID=A0A2I0L5R6_PUNGR|nr:hypothetical protein CRG98_003618 [Punica granatum]